MSNAALANAPSFRSDRRSMPSTANGDRPSRLAIAQVHFELNHRQASDHVLFSKRTVRFPSHFSHSAFFTSAVVERAVVAAHHIMQVIGRLVAA